MVDEVPGASSNFLGPVVYGQFNLCNDSVGIPLGDDGVFSPTRRVLVPTVAFDVKIALEIGVDVGDPPWLFDGHPGGVWVLRHETVHTSVEFGVLEAPPFQEFLNGRVVPVSTASGPLDVYTDPLRNDNFGDTGERHPKLSE